MHKKLGDDLHGKASQGDVDSFIDNNLSQSQAKAVRELLSDEEKTRALLNSDAARALFRKLFGGKDDG